MQLDGNDEWGTPSRSRLIFSVFFKVIFSTSCIETPSRRAIVTRTTYEFQIGFIL
jgi:hypothetical protein